MQMVIIYEVCFSANERQFGSVFERQCAKIGLDCLNTRIGQDFAEFMNLS